MVRTEGVRIFTTKKNMVGFLVSSHLQFLHDTAALTLSMLGKVFGRPHTEIFFLIFQENRF